MSEANEIGMKEILGDLLRMSGPCVLSQIIGFSNRLIGTFIVSHYGTNEFAAASLAIVVLSYLI